MKPTRNQQQFLDINHANVLVSASAGCGKTTTMIQKLIKLILLEHVRVDDFLVVTFTNVAGLEMKQKLYKALYNAILEKDFTLDEQFQLTEQLENIGQADIGTLHSFCKKLIDQYFYVIDLDPKYVILEENEQQYLLLKALSNVLNAYRKEKDDQFQNLFDYFNKSRQSANFTQSILQLHSYLSSKSDKNDWKIEKENFLKEGEYVGQQIVCYLFDFFKKKFGTLRQVLTQLLEDCRMLNLTKYQLSLQQIEDMLLNIDKTKSLWELDQVVMGQTFTKVRRSKNIEPECLDFIDRYDTFFGENKPSWDSFRGVISAYKKYVQLEEGYCSKSEVESRIRKVIPFIQKLFEVEERVSKAYALLKAKQNGLDFNDLEQKVLLILENETIRKEISQKYKAIFVDEYQDISDAQERIIERIQGNCPLYMIGDVKQSIYGFRHCTPAIFLQKVDRFSNDGKDNVLLGLNDNFRSNEQVLSWVNYVCNYLMTKETIGIDYATTSLLNSGSDNQKVSVEPAITFQIVTGQDSDDLGGIKAQAQAVLATISHTLGSEFYDIAQSCYRKVTYKDVAILTHNKGRLVEEIYSLLTENEIPVSSSFNSNLFHTEEIGTLVAVLNVLNNVQDEQALAILLLSPIGNFSEKELVNIKKNGTTFLEDVLSYDKEDTTKEKLEKCFGFVKKYRSYLEHHTVVECLKEIIFDYDLKNYYQTLPDGISRVNRIHLFLSLINSESLQYSLKATLEYIEEISKKENFEITLSAGEDAIQMLTMHKSKGLEYPFVILAGLSTQFNEESLRQDIVISNKFGIGIRSRDMDKRVEQNNLLRSACVLDKLEEEKKEEIRLLYVAMTRAKNHLTLLGYQKEEKIIQKHPLLCRSHFEMICSCIPSNLQEVIYRNKKGEISFGDCKVRYIVGAKEERIELKEQRKPILCEYSLQQYEQISELVSRNNALVESNPIALKNTVSEMLMMEQEDYTNFVDSPQSFTLSDQHVTSIHASDIGTAYHKVMEHIHFDFSQNAQNVVEELFQKNLISAELKKKINIEKINHAILSISQFVDKNSILFKEAKFMYKDKHKHLVKDSQLEDSILIQGMVDLFIKNGNKGVLVDYKTNKFLSENDFITKYQKQLALYALAIKEAYKLDNLECYIYSFDLEKIIKISS